MPLSATLAISAFAELSQAIDLGTGRVPQALSRSVQLTTGTTAGKADKVFSDRRTLAASASEDLDLAGVLLDAFGAAITFVKVKGLFIAAAEDNANNVVVGAAAATPWAALLGATGTVALRPGAACGFLAGPADATGYAVTAGTADLLKVANSGGSTSVTYDIVIVGTSA
jgi:hypothetical protein